MKKSKFTISEFVLKIIGLITMTFDHVGIFFYDVQNLNKLGIIFRSIGRIAFPIFVFMLVEGVKHTSNFKKYLHRLGVIDAIIIIAEILGSILTGQLIGMACPFTDLILLALIVKLLNNKDKTSFFALIPIAYIILCGVVKTYEIATYRNVEFLPELIRADECTFGLVLALGFNYSGNIIKFVFRTNENTKNLEVENLDQKSKNLMSGIVIVLTSLCYYLFYKIIGADPFYLLIAFDSIAMLPILFYSGERGYNKKWFRIFSYLYFPLHLVLIFIIMVLTGVIL